MLLQTPTEHIYVHPRLSEAGCVLLQALTPIKAGQLVLLVPENIQVPKCHFRNVCQELLGAEDVKARAAVIAGAALV